MQVAESIVESLQLVAHPEGGWYRETWRAEAGEGIRSPGTAILYLLETGCRSHWHRVDADEMWLWHAGAPLDLLIADANDANPARITLGGDVTRGYTPQALVPATRWQSAEARDGWALVSCVVVPASTLPGSRWPRPTGRRRRHEIPDRSPLSTLSTGRIASIAGLRDSQRMTASFL